MTISEFDQIIIRLSGAFTYNKFTEKGVIAEYKRALMKYGFEQMNRAIDNLIESTDGKNVPPIGLLIKSCRDNKPTAAEVHNSTRCDACNDKGYILLTEYVKNGSEQLPYQYVYYCPHCHVGQAQAYNGNNSKDHKVNAVCQPITSVLDEQAIEQLKYSNNHLKQMTDSEKEILRKKLNKIGLPLPKVLDRGDAWEGDAECPF
jgi:hypothetical protein